MKRLGRIFLRTLLFLSVAMLGLDPSPRGDRSTAPATRSGSGKAEFHYALSSACSPTSSTLRSLSRLTPCRHRIKTVLEDGDARGLQPVDLGPLIVPEGLNISIGSPPRMARSKALIRLRC
jgi:hypothetical protein